MFRRGKTKLHQADMPKPDEIIPTRETLLSRLKDWQDDESWGEFIGIYRRLIFSFARKSGLNETEADEVVQETLISIAKTIKEFQYDPQRCSFKSWLRHLTQKRVADAFRRRARVRQINEAQPTPNTAKTPVIERVPDPASTDLDALWEAEWQKELLDAAVARVKTQISATQFQIFDFYVLKKKSVTKVAATLGTNTAQVYLAKHRVCRLIKKEIGRLEANME